KYRVYLRPAMNDRLAYEAPILGLFCFISNLTQSIPPNPFMGFTYERGIYPREDKSDELISTFVENIQIS
ncbi:MAG: hypothetical protein ACQETF_11925, partial [Bacteroidota bacterium]